uniref:Calsyntenin-1 n=1 Tax=Macrostomum lignano TaxID=282301 RepID=A0A1I8I6R0_9PLAT
DFLPTLAIAAIAVAIFIFGVLLSVSVFLLLLNRHRNTPVLENAKRRSAAKVLSDLKNRLSSRSEHTYLTSDRRPEISTVERYEMAPYDVISDAETKPDEVSPEQEVEPAAGSNRFNSELSSAYDVIPDLTAGQKQQNQRAAQQVKSNQPEECC